MTQSTQDVLKNILNIYGITICSESKRLQGILQDWAIESKGKIKALVSVAEENVVNELFKNADHQVDYALYSRLVTRVHQNTAIEQSVVEWAIDCWIHALDKSVPHKPIHQVGKIGGGSIPKNQSVNQMVAFPTSPISQPSQAANGIPVKQSSTQPVVTQNNQNGLNQSTVSQPVKRSKVAPVLVTILIAIGVITGGYKLFSSEDAVDSSNGQEMASADESVSVDVEPDKEEGTNQVTKEVTATNPGEYIFPESNTKRLTESEIANLTYEQLRLARNEIYARHGYLFKSEDLQTYFNQKSWYHEDASYDGVTLSEIEKSNVELIKNLEKTGFIMPGSDQRRLSESELANLTLEELRLARNEIYARHGYIFNSENLNSYFQQKSWYHEDASYDGITLSEIEKYNVEMIQNSERSIQ
ncbi:YARHG domain-containing protein [Bacillus sp. X1(2014)]|uniref:YARHG domain-containing protein n=1 Tax=Bacillus sp. X1(2014) TaxID=1565991 RepID=UPI0011A1F8C3|nr:YARHG domain-containing protein [Bacillus sp. X1(2014)]